MEQTRVATKVNEEGERVHRFVDELNDVKWRPKPIKLRDKVGAILHFMRQNCSWTALSHLVNISPEVLRVFFHEFIDWIYEYKFHEEVYFPRILQREIESNRVTPAPVFPAALAAQTAFIFGPR